MFQFSDTFHKSGSSKTIFCSNRVFEVTKIFPLPEDSLYGNSFSSPEHGKIEIMKLPLKNEKDLSHVTHLMSSFTDTAGASD